MNIVFDLAASAAPFVAIATACIILWALKARNDVFQTARNDVTSVFDEAGVVERRLNPTA